MKPFMFLSRPLVGRFGEYQAARYLIQQGYCIVERNVHTRFGEIDIIAEKNAILFFVEVKTRSNLHYGVPAESVSPQKLRRIIQSIYCYLQKTHTRDTIWEIHIIGIFLEQDRVHLKHERLTEV